MKKLILIPSFLVVIFLISSCSSVSKMNQIAQQEYLNRIILIEKFIREKGTNEGEKLDQAIGFLEAITNIKSEFIPGKEIFFIPSEQNLRDWKDWFKANRKRLLWDDSTQKVILKDTI